MDIPKEFIDEPGFDREQYDEYIKRIHYEDRDVIMYEDMLRFLWSYIIGDLKSANAGLENVSRSSGKEETCPGMIEDREGLLEEYSHWNLQMIDKCFHGRPHDKPYVQIRRAYQSIIHLLDGDLSEGLRQLSLIGQKAFDQDGRPGRVHMTKEGKVYQPVSRLFLIYNYAKVLARKAPDRLAPFKEDYPFAFRQFDDGRHDIHDFFLHDQMVNGKDLIFYPEYERVYKVPGGDREFYLYFDREHGIPIERIMGNSDKTADEVTADQV